MMERVNHERVYSFFVYVRMAEDTDDSLVYLFGCYVFYCGGGNGDSLRGEEFCGKKSVDNLSLLSCREEIANESQNEWC